MDGCPVDAIHRGPQSLEVRIDSHCIGCGLCAANCPYASIQMAPRDARQGELPRVAAIAHRAVNCDLCQGLVPPGAEPFCVSACPHDAAFRWTGEKLYETVSRQR
jgi:Fe-S-cluster-containing dehydrogenase component